MSNSTAQTTDVREWARARGLQVGEKGRLKADYYRDYAADVAAGAWPGVGGNGSTPASPPAELPELPELGDDVTGADLPGEKPRGFPTGSVDKSSTPAAPAEAKPKRPHRRTAGGRAGGLFARARAGAKAPKAAKARRPRVSLAGLIEDAWSQCAWAAAPIPPLQRLLYAQAPFAGMALEDAIRGTVVDHVLQPVARAEDAAKAVGGLVCPPAALLAVLATAPPPQVVEHEGKRVLVAGEPSTQHKGAILMFRWSLMLMAEAGEARLAEYSEKAEANSARGAQVDQFMAWILGGEPPPEAADMVREEQEAVTRAQTLFGAAHGG